MAAKPVFKGAVSKSEATYYDFAELKGQPENIIQKRKTKLLGYWFSKDFVLPAILEKSLKGVTIQVDPRITKEHKDWAEANCSFSAYFASESTRKPTIIHDLLIRSESLSSLETLLRQYLLLSRNSRRYSRYYLPLLITWINSYDYSDMKYDRSGNEYKLPLRQLTVSRQMASEIVQLPGGELIYYALLSKLERDCDDQKLVQFVIDFISTNKRLLAAAAFVPDEICDRELRCRVNETRIDRLF
ncbi:MAG: hypothetical protein IPJ30_12585 [Acidobacteria bacterium]|nr:hypothetical protein [Acidobacteriota bacterium]